MFYLLQLTNQIIGFVVKSLHWQKDEEIITPQTNPRYQLIAKGRFLMILAIKRQDDGIYTCIARNEAGEVCMSFNQAQKVS